ncbi:MAG TPA: TetR/AcrR family transcriptional regulator [Oligoflexus sp.]|uniref:TetR/AcrR family transcriptional regulator n=1 Tax=Oligoflexus sp. TaxID=1971216 RepID=UPI002D56EFA0|nr:TetR/AcrR family transcriptional regulator [Oligoflexus sp.]HYX32435.1 TetR/AcrR family transcriptional regulator [Oligoflexus sp.]
MRASRLNSRRSKLLEASLKVFARKGFHQTAVSDIVDASRIGHGTFYGYFQSKAAVFKALLESIYGKILQQLIAEPFDACLTLDDYRAQLMRIGDRLFELFQKQPELARVVLYESWVAEGDITALTQTTFDAFRRFTQLYLQHGVSRGYLRADIDTETAASAINMMLFEAMKSVLRSEQPELEYAKWKRVVPIMIIDGLGAQQRG